LRVENEDCCPACGNKGKGSGAIAVVSPWVLELAGIKQPEVTNFSECEKCHSGWFSIRYSDLVLSSLYQNYRGRNYFDIRNSWEPTYSNQLNDGLNNGADWLKGRRNQINDSLEAAGCDTSTMFSVFDFGGGHGGVMPIFPKRYLYEANKDANPIEGIELINDWNTAKSLRLDLVMCCGVLEHVNNPSELISHILELNAEVFLFEVPAGTPLKRIGPSNNSQVLRKLSGSKLLWRRVQIIERHFSHRLRKYFPLRCSEHLQFFSLKGFELLLERSGLEVLELTETFPNHMLADSKKLGFEDGLIAICRKKQFQNT